MTQESGREGDIVALPSGAKTAQYQKARNIGLLLFLFQLAILVLFVQSRTLLADTFHAFLDMITLAGTALLYKKSRQYEAGFEHLERRWLLVGVWSLGIGGLAIGGEAAYHLTFHGVNASPPTLWLLAAVFAGMIGNWWMHRILESVDKGEHDALHKNNMDHVFWDMVLSLAVFCSWCSMLIIGTNAWDHYIAMVVGFLILPYLAWRRWGEHSHAHHGHHHH